MKYSLRIIKNKNLFKRHKYPSLNALSIKYFQTLSYNHWGFFGITKLSNPHFQEKVCPKKRMDAALVFKLIYNGNVFHALKKFIPYPIATPISKLLRLQNLIFGKTIVQPDRRMCFCFAREVFTKFWESSISRIKAFLVEINYHALVIEYNFL